MSESPRTSLRTPADCVCGVCITCITCVLADLRAETLQVERTLRARRWAEHALARPASPVGRDRSRA